jgi:hypothetical protein
MSAFASHRAVGVSLGNAWETCEPLSAGGVYARAFQRPILLLESSGVRGSARDRRAREAETWPTIGSSTMQATRSGPPGHRWQAAAERCRRVKPKFAPQTSLQSPVLSGGARSNSILVSRENVTDFFIPRTVLAVMAEFAPGRSGTVGVRHGSQRACRAFPFCNIPPRKSP